MYYSTGILSTISSNAKWVTLFTTLGEHTAFPRCHPIADFQPQSTYS